MPLNKPASPVKPPIVKVLIGGKVVLVSKSAVTPVQSSATCLIIAN